MKTLVLTLALMKIIIPFIVGIWVLVKQVNDNTAWTFWFYTFINAIWGMVICDLFFIHPESTTDVKLIYSVGAAMLITTVPMAMYFVKEKVNKYFVYSIYLMAGFIFFSGLWDPMLMFNVSTAKFTFDFGPTFYVYGTLTFGAMGFAIFSLFKGVFNSTGIKKKQLSLVLMGFIFYWLCLFSNRVVLSYLKMTPAVPYDAIGSLIFVIIIAYALIFLSEKKEKATASYSL